MRWIVLVLILLAGSAEAQPRRRASPDVLERLERMSPDERRRFLDNLPPGRRARIQEHLRRLETLTPGERARLRQGFRRFRQMAPERQEQARSLFRRFQTFPELRRRMMRLEVFRLRGMDPRNRQERIESRDYRENFNPPEREMIRDLLDFAVPTL